jgi:hypothetical protein
LLQTVCVPGHVQRPALHDVPDGHTVRHAPQLSGSVIVLLQLRPHLVSPAPQLVAQVELEQTCPAAHARPHMPQLAASEVRFTHAVPHLVKPV